MEKVAVLGATGMAGHAISLYLEEKGYDVYRMSRSISPSEKCARIDIQDFSALTNWLEKIKPDIIINSIGIIPKEDHGRVDLEILINSYLPHMLEQNFKDSQTKIIHLSTDCVFSGITGGYTETAPTDGTTIYDRSKALGELNNNKDLTLRMSIIGPDINPNGVGLFNWFMRQNGRIQGYRRALWNGITTIELAKAIDVVIKQNNLVGLYHLTPNGSINKYELLNIFKEVFEKNDVEIIPYDDFEVDKTLVNTRIDFDFELLSYPMMIQEMALWMKKHKGLYDYE